MNSARLDPISFPLFLLLLIVVIVIILILIEPRFSKRKLKNNNEHGSSRFSTLKDIKKNFQKEEIKNISSAGFPVWYEKIKNNFTTVYFDNKSPHFLLVGSTGAGKSVTVSIPTSIHFATAKEKHSVVLTDPKGELFKTTGKIFEDNGYDIVTIDFRNPTKSTKVNIMQPIIYEWKQHCHFNKCMMFFLTHFVKANKLSLPKISTNISYRNQIKEKYKLDDYVIDILINNSKDIERNKKIRNYMILTFCVNILLVTLRIF